MPQAAEPWVLDTNVVLDWLVFDDPQMRTPADWLRAGRACWAYTTPMREEIDEVVGRDGVLRRSGASPQALRQRVAAACAVHGRLLQPAARCAWVCADPDDQMFLDLAAQLAPGCLLSRDKALLSLAGVAAGSGLRILSPRQLRAALLSSAAAGDATR